VYKIIYGIGLSLLLLGGAAYFKDKPNSLELRPCVDQLTQIHELFPDSADGVKKMLEKAISHSKLHLEALMRVEDKGRTFSNTIIQLDQAIEELHIAQAALYVLTLASPSEEVREAASQAVTQLRSYTLDACTLHEGVYKAVHAYDARLMKEQHELISPEQRYFLAELLKEFKRNGLELSQKKRARATELQKEFAQLAITFDTNIAASRDTVAVARDELKGMDEGFMRSFTFKTEEKNSIPLDQTTVKRILERCEVASTRKKFYQAFMRRAYPENEKVLSRMVAVGDELARELGYESYAHFALDEQMVKTPERAQEFLSMLLDSSRTIVQREFTLLKQGLPPSVVLKDGKFQPWDVAFVYDVYKRKHLQLDEALVSQYFPLEYTLPALLRIYEDFFGLSFVKLPKVDLWHKDLRAYAVYRKGQYRGTIILDLFPRPHKFTHAGHITVVPSLYDRCGPLLPGVGVLVTNFEAPQPDKPSLLKRSDVVVFFHEFGHALHALLGATTLASVSGTSTKQDFVEMPSQLLEEWLWSGEILQAISSHVKTHEPLPDAMIQTIIASKHFDAGDMILRQLFYAHLSLAFFLKGGQKPLSGLWQKLGDEIRFHIASDPENKGYCSFIHLSGYGPRYYGYLWSKVFALDLFGTIVQSGLRNAATGDRYITQILSKGGGKDPNELLIDFLGRKPSIDAFLKDLQHEQLAG